MSVIDENQSSVWPVDLSKSLRQTNGNFREASASNWPLNFRLDYMVNEFVRKLTKKLPREPENETKEWSTS